MSTTTSSSKKNLLAKLKKDVAKTKKPPSPGVVEKTTKGGGGVIITPTPSISDIQKELIRAAFTATTPDDLATILQTHSNFYPVDASTIRLLTNSNLSFEDTIEILKTVMETTPFDFNNTIRQAVLQKHETQGGMVGGADADSFATSLLQSLRSIVVINTASLVALNPGIFEVMWTIPFLDDRHEQAYCTEMLRSLIESSSSFPPGASEPLFQKWVRSYIFNHRFQYLIRVLEDPGVAHDAKQTLVTRYLQNQYQNLRSLQFFLLMMEIVDKKTYPFRKALDALLYRFIADRKFIPRVRKTLSLALDVIIKGDTTDKHLSKFFLTKMALNKFKNRVLPLLVTPDSARRYLQTVTWEELPQPFLFRHAHRVGWEPFLQLLKTSVTSSSLQSMDTRLVDLILEDRSPIIETILKILNNDGEDESSSPDTTLKKARIHVHRFIQTFHKPGDRKILNRLLTVSRAALLRYFNETSVSDYIEQCKDLVPDLYPATTTTSPLPLPTAVKRNVVEWDDMDLEFRVYLEEHRLEIPDFQKLLLRVVPGGTQSPKQLEYIKEPFEKTADMFVPTPRFFRDCVQKTTSQQGNVFTVDGVSFHVVYYLWSKQIIVQDENLWRAHTTFVGNHVAVKNSSTPLEYFRYFVDLPILNHASRFMNRFRDQQIQRMRELGIPEPIKIEESVYATSDTIKMYLECFAKLYMVIDASNSPFFGRSTYLRSLMTKGVLDLSKMGTMLGMPLSTTMSFLFPEYYLSSNAHLRPVLLTKASVKFEHVFRDMVLRAFIMENPMSRIPILPSTTEITTASLGEVVTVTDDSVLYGPAGEEWNGKPVSEAREYDEIGLFFHRIPQPPPPLSPSDSSSLLLDDDDDNNHDLHGMSSSTTNDMVVAQPLDSFLDVARDLLDVL